MRQLLLDFRSRPGALHLQPEGFQRGGRERGWGKGEGGERVDKQQLRLGGPEADPGAGGDDEVLAAPSARTGEELLFHTK